MLQDVPDNDLIVQPEKEPDESKQEGSEMEKSLPFHWIGSSGQSRLQSEFSFICNLGRVSVQGVESLWGDCRFIPADWGS